MLIPIRIVMQFKVQKIPTPYNIRCRYFDLKVHTYFITNYFLNPFFFLNIVYRAFNGPFNNLSYVFS